MRNITEFEVVNIYPGKGVDCKFYFSRGYEFYKEPIVVKDEVIQIMVKYEEEISRESSSPGWTFPPTTPLISKGSSKIHLAPIDYKPKSFLWWQENRSDNNPKEGVEVIIKMKGVSNWNYNTVKYSEGKFYCPEYSDYSVEKWAYIPD